MFLILKLLFCLFRLVKLDFNFSLTSPFLSGSLKKKYYCYDIWKKNPLVFKKKVFFKGFRKAVQMKTAPWLPNWSTCWLLQKKTHFCRSSCHLAELRSAGTGLSARGSTGGSKAPLMSHVSWCLHCGSVRVCSANQNNDTPTSFAELKHSWVVFAQGRRRAGGAWARGWAAFCVALTFGACEVQHFLSIY